MFERSVIKTTGQWSKAVISFCAVIVGGVIMLVGSSRLNASDYVGPATMLGGGAFLFLGGVILAVTAVRCPKCRARWVWLGLSKQASDEWLTWLLSRSECPRCGYASTSGPVAT